jgi:glutathione synthase/RimK-type ligase-like ATP-grasp enzyme
MKIALVTYNDQGKYASTVEDEDTRLLNFLRAKGLDIRFEVWDDPAVNWPAYRLILLKSPWDYFDKIAAFYDWLDRIERLRIPTLNPVPVLRWNCDKRYLADIARAGLPVIPTAFLEKGQHPELLAFFREFAAGKLIVKPCVSGGAKNTFTLSREDLAEGQQRVAQLLADEAFMVQPFIPEIQQQGEWSFVFFNGKFSHSLLKKARPGDFRVQHYLGGTIHTKAPPARLIRAAETYVSRFAEGCLYARVDGIEVNGTFMLMELELIEPFLFLFTDPPSYERYYQALVEMSGQP